jgi:hypothetical protein
MVTVLTAADCCAVVAWQVQDSNDLAKQFANPKRRRPKFRPRLNLGSGQWRTAFLAVAGGVPALFALTACAPMMPVAVSRLSLLADALSYVQTGKSLSDHAVSSVTGTDCRTFNVASGRPICSTSNHVAPVEERGPSNSVNAEAQFSASTGIATSSKQVSIPDALRATTLPQVSTGPIERFDCASGTPDWHARIAFEAQDGHVLGFAYYSKWKPRTCSIHVARDTTGSTWYAAPDHSVHVDTPHGRFVIRTSVDVYVFEFRNVQRGKFCGMPGEINGTMTIKRDTARPACSAVGLMDTNDSYLEALYGTASVKGPAAQRSPY